MATIHLTEHWDTFHCPPLSLTGYHNNDITPEWEKEETGTEKDTEKLSLRPDKFLLGFDGRR